VKVTVQMDGLAGVLATLKALPPEVVSQRGGPVRAAVRNSSKIIRDEARLQMQARGQEAGKTGVSYATGFSASHIIMKRTKLTAIKGERFVVTVKPVPHPNGNRIGKRPLRANDAAFIMEAGSATQPAEPWMRPAFAAKKEIATRAMETELVKAVDKIVKKLALKNRGR
jgi:hypothetical protein